MHVDLHQAMRQIIDKSLLGEASIHEQQTLQEHLASCALCQDYLDASNRVIAGLGGFSFEVDPALQGKVMESLTLRAQTLRSSQPRPMWWNYLAALILTAAGSFTVALFTPMSLRAGVFALWILPSLCFCLLFPVLHRLSTGEKGLSQ
jgi:anti-sigma factor RsiW